MTRSMTGYGQARWEGQGRVMTAEVRSVNGRYFKLVTHLPNELAPSEQEIDKLIRRRIHRGTVDLYVKLDFVGARAARPVNVDALRNYVEQLEAVAGGLGVSVVLTPEALSALPGVLDSPAMTGDEADALHEGLVTALGTALDRLDAMRETEGANLREALLGHATAIEAAVEAVEAGHPDAQQRYAERLTERVARLLEKTDVTVAQADLAREIAIYAERSSVCEEIARLRSHVQQLRAALDRDKPVGRHLEFLAQEMHRESNTMGAKVADVALSERIVGLHGEVDKIREQVANIE